jgi:hypothetical protein
MSSREASAQRSKTEGRPARRRPESVFHFQPLECSIYNRCQHLWLVVFSSALSEPARAAWFHSSAAYDATRRGSGPKQYNQLEGRDPQRSCESSDSLVVIAAAFSDVSARLSGEMLPESWQPSQRGLITRDACLTRRALSVPIRSILGFSRSAIEKSHTQESLLFGGRPVRGERAGSWVVKRRSFHDVINYSEPTADFGRT